MPAPHYIAQKISDKYILVRTDTACNLATSALLLGATATTTLAFSQRGLKCRLLLATGAGLFLAGLVNQGRHAKQNRSPKSRQRFTRGPSYPHDNEGFQPRQKPTDEVEEASMESFPASDPPARNA